MENGDIDEIQMTASGYFWYKTITTESVGFVDPSAPWFTWSYYQRARKKAKQADVIITNHALLCTDIFNDYKFLPPYEKAIIDEAHHLETTASRHYGLKLDYVTMQYTLNQIGMIEDGNWLHKTLLKYPLINQELPTGKWNNLLTQTKHEIDDLFRTLFQYVMDQKRSSKSLSDIGRIQYRFEETK